MIKFNLTANDMQREGFKVSVQAEKDEEIKLVSDLMDKLISKISVIEIKPMNEGDGY